MSSKNKSQPPLEVVTVIEATYIATEPNNPQPKFIGLWYHNGHKAKLLLLSLERTDILSLEAGDKGTLAKNGARWEFTPRSH